LEKNLLDRPLTIDELDKAVLEGKNNTASGCDGLNNKFIKKFWQLLRVPLFNYATTCINKGILTDTFKGANIKLIPKKGNPSSIKDWRPISLLPCIYKVISRAVNNRLKSFTDRFTSRAQKGFTKSRYIQEVLFNVLQNIYHCRAENINGAIVSIDFAKAFDTVYHGFVRESFKFFGVGNYMLNVMDTLGTNRTANILLDNGSVTRSFNLGTGRPQGETTSPGQFNVGEQVLIFRIELDPGVASVYQHMIVPRNNFPVLNENLPVDFREESNAESDKTDCFADDASATTLAELDSISNLKSILQSFSVISGLKCNLDKTCILLTNPNIDANLYRQIENTGFKIKNEIKLLGFNLTRDGINSTDYFTGVNDRIGGIIRFWDRFFLSLPGRITVLKTLLLSQISYGGSFMMPPRAVLNDMQDQCNKFVIQGQKISIERIYATTCSGGLGLIKIEDFIRALQAVWIGRAFRSTRDCWRVDLHNITAGNPLTINGADPYF
jgi:Reverse transcriptase (RNA-dependent DNA polymerase)